MSHGVQRQLAVGYERLGEAHAARCEHKKALRAHRTALQLFDGLLSHDPENPKRIHERGGCLSRIGSLLLAQGSVSEAQSAYEECLRLARKLVAQDSTSADWQRNLLVSYGHVAEVRKLLGDAAGALELHRRALEIAVYLADRDPDSAEHAATLAICHANVGRALAAGERHEEALASYACALRIIEPIVERNSIDAALQSDWARLLAEIAASERRADNESSAQSHFERSRLVLARMRKAGMALVGPPPEGLLQDTPDVAPAQPKTWWQFWR
jgi:tetratricopeptide (TPR) repeat protein